MAEFRPLIIARPEVRSIKCGSVTVQWVDAKQALDEDALFLTLPTGEQDIASPMKSKDRWKEYVRSRWLVHQMVGGTFSLDRGAFGEIHWPEGIVGSISHKLGHVACSVIAKGKIQGVGIDIEDSRKMREAFLERICTDKDKAWIESLSKPETPERTRLLALLFSAKESLFKCHFPSGRTPFFFPDAEVAGFDEGRKEIELTVLKDTSRLSPKGSIHPVSYLWLESHLVLTAVTLASGSF